MRPHPALVGFVIVDGHVDVFKVECLINKRLKPKKSNCANILR